MNRHYSLRILAALTLVTALAASSLFAQTVQLRATIPFDFYVANQLLPAGVYTVAPQAKGDVIKIYDGKGNSAQVISRAQVGNRAVDMSRLVFHKYGTTAFLSEIFWEGYRTGREMTPSRIERELAQQSAAVRVAIISQ